MTLEWDESCGDVWEALAASPEPLSGQSLSEQGIEMTDVRRAIARLQTLDLITKVQATPRPMYQAVVNLDALKWAKAVEIGVHIDRLERWATLDREGRFQALEIASNGALAIADQAARDAKAVRRREYLAGEAASRVAATDLARLLADAELVLKGLPANPNETFDQTAARVALEQVQREASSALQALQETFQRS